MMTGLANVGDVLAGKYRVDRILGIGGMGMVVQAIHLELDQKVALKFMLPEALESPEASARFLREARAAGKLRGEHICRVSDVGRFASGAPYIVMEYLEGYDLMTLMKRRGPLPIAEAVDYILQACEGMAEAHSLGIIHRDLKPDNLFLATRADGSKIVKVLDFGISKATVAGLATRTGELLGSPAYMSPEQMQSTRDVDARADIWSLGIVLHQLLGGQMVFTGDTIPALYMAVLDEPAKNLRELREDVPPPLADAVAKALEKDREHRHADVAELAQAIAPFGSATAASAVTRVRSLLRGQPEPSTLPPTAEAFASGDGDELSTLADASMNAIPRSHVTSTDRPNPTPPPASKLVTTTLRGSAGSSSDLPRRRGTPLVVFGAALGIAGLIVLVAVMSMRRDAGDVEYRRDAAMPPPTVAPAPPAAPTAIEPTVRPVVEPTAATTAGSAARDPRVKKLTKKKDPKASKSGVGSEAKPAVRVDAGAKNDDDKWGKMLNDKPSSGAP